jgi:hypothetical protein
MTHFSPEGGNTFLQNVGSHLQEYTVAQSERPQSIYLWP